MTACPRCGEPAERGQLVCLNAAPASRSRRSRWRAPLAASTCPPSRCCCAVVVLGAGAFGFALSELTDDSGRRQRRGRPHVRADAVGRRRARPRPTPTPARPSSASQSLLLEWPEGLTGYTVVLMTTGDRPAARRVAREAAQSGLEAGLLRSDDYDLGTDLWIVFAGRFDTQASAERQAANLAERYPGAYADAGQAGELAAARASSRLK